MVHGKKYMSGPKMLKDMLNLTSKIRTVYKCHISSLGLPNGGKTITRFRTACIYTNFA